MVDREAAFAWRDTRDEMTPDDRSCCAREGFWPSVCQGRLSIGAVLEALLDDSLSCDHDGRNESFEFFCQDRAEADGVTRLLDDTVFSSVVAFGVHVGLTSPNVFRKGDDEPR